MTWFSCIASSSATWVFGEARLISSTRRTFAKTGPGLNSNSFALVEDVDAGDVGREQVGRELDREKSRWSDRAGDFASIVFPTPESPR